MSSRSGQGMVLALVLLVCGLLATIGVASYLQSGGTGRALVRVLSSRSAIEAGDSALAEAAARVRESMDTGARSPACPDDWHDLVFRTIQGITGGQTKLDPAGRTYTLVPLVTRTRIPTDDCPVTISDVTAKLVNCFVPDQLGGVPPNPPQGILELSVTVRGPGKVVEVVRTIRQRRLFYATITQPIVPGMQVQPESVLLYLSIDPIGTAIE